MEFKRTERPSSTSWPLAVPKCAGITHTTTSFAAASLCWNTQSAHLLANHGALSIDIVAAAFKSWTSHQAQRGKHACHCCIQLQLLVRQRCSSAHRASNRFRFRWQWPASSHACHRQALQADPCHQSKKAASAPMHCRTTHACACQTHMHQSSDPTHDSCCRQHTPRTDI